MSMGPLSGLGGVAGSPLAQTHGSDTEKTQADGANQARQSQSEKKAESASGVGETEQDEGASDRDADGRRLWEAPPGGATDDENKDGETDSPVARSKDASGDKGSQLDLTG